MDDAVVSFANRVNLRKWFLKNHETAKGMWISFVKNAPRDVLKATEALEEALCFGWIDGQIKRIDNTVYVKYFAPRTENSAWSAKNIAIMKRLIAAGLAHDHGKAVFLNRNQTSAAGGRSGSNDVAAFIALIGRNRGLLEGYRALSPSNQRRMAGFYFEAKQQETRKRRMVKIERAIKEGYKGMLY